MLELDYTSQIKRDLKLIGRRRKELSKLKAIVNLLQEEKTLPEKCRNHKLTGDYKDHWECHIEPDWLLIYYKNSSTLTLVRTGTHADLFD